MLFCKTLISNARLRFDQNNNNLWYQKELRKMNIINGRIAESRALLQQRKLSLRSYFVV